MALLDRRCSTGRKPVSQSATALPHLRTEVAGRGATQGPVFFRKLTPPKRNKVESASSPSRSRDTLGLSGLGQTLEPQRGEWPLRVLTLKVADFRLRWAA